MVSCEEGRTKQILGTSQIRLTRQNRKDRRAFLREPSVMNRMRPICIFILLAIAILTAANGSRAADTGYQAEVTVKQPTRLDWEFVASGFGKDAARLPGDYDSAQQRYQL